MESIDLNIKDEVSPLESVILGLVRGLGDPPNPKEAIDPKSKEHLDNNTYPKEEDMVPEIDAFYSVLEKHQVKVYRPEMIAGYNQIFSRDIGFVIEDTFIRSNILPQRAGEIKAIEYIMNEINPNKLLFPPDEVHIEGGDVMLGKDHIFVGTYYGKDYPDIITARTNAEAVTFLKKAFPTKKVKAFDLKKSNTDAKRNALHLDCVFQPVGEKYAIIHKEGFSNLDEYQYLVDLYGTENLFHITADEMYQMFSNVFSISPGVVVSERNFHRLNDWLESIGINVERIPYAEIAKQEGLLRCSTLPLKRKNV